jgi:hypothetical protein
MPDNRRHRGPHPADPDLFGEAQVSALQHAVRDLSWLLTRGYGGASALKLVADRFQLVDRQRTAVMRCACSDQSLEERQQRRTDPPNGQSVAIDGFNLITTIEAALSGGVLIRGRDDCLRDMASMHGTYRRVEETIPALTLIGERLAAHGVGEVLWLLDNPVSNSGRLKQVIEEVAGERGWNWSAQLDRNPDEALVRLQEHLIVSADSYVIENSEQWWSLANDVVESCVESVWVVDCGALKI